MSEVVKTKSNGNLFKILIFVMLLVLLVGGAGFGGYYFASKSVPKSSTINTKSAANVDEAFYDAGEFLVNLADTDSPRYLKIKLIVAYDSSNKKLTKELETKVNVIKDSAISVMRTKKAADMTAKGAEDLKGELVTRINSVLTTGKLTNAYYNDFLVQ